jgi:hypothetical protein
MRAVCPSPRGLLRPQYVCAVTRRRFQVALPLFVLALAALLYLPFAAAGTGVVGFLPRYLEEQGLSSGDGVFWLALLGKAGLLRPTTSAVFAGSVGAATVGLALWTRRRSANDISSQLRGTTFLLVAFFLHCLSPSWRAPMREPEEEKVPSLIVLSRPALISRYKVA